MSVVFCFALPSLLLFLGERSFAPHFSVACVCVRVCVCVCVCVCACVHAAPV